MYSSFQIKLKKKKIYSFSYIKRALFLLIFETVAPKEVPDKFL